VTIGIVGRRGRSVMREVLLAVGAEAHTDERLSDEPTTSFERLRSAKRAVHRLVPEMTSRYWQIPDDWHEPEPVDRAGGRSQVPSDRDSAQASATRARPTSDCDARSSWIRASSSPIGAM
jgi:hypothetical protein